MHKIGDTVHIPVAESATHAGNYMVVKINPTTYGLRRIDDGAKLRASHGLVRPGITPTSATTFGVPYVSVEVFDPGTVVTVKDTKINPETLYVVIASVPRGYRIAALGGSARYWTGVPATRLTRVTELKEWRAP